MDDEGALKSQLRRLLEALEAVGRVEMPGTAQSLLQAIVEAAARLFGAAASSIALVDDTAGSLDFIVACGAGHEAVLGRRIPIGQGIAGYVAMTGQPLAVSDVQRDPRFAGDFARSTGYVPRSILATPLMSGDRVIGVMEVLDKIEAPSFGLRDMELLSLFARQAAIAIDQSRTLERLGEALVLGLGRLTGDAASADVSSALEHLAALAHRDQGEPMRAKDLLALSDLFRAAADLGDDERRLALGVLGAVADYARARAGGTGRASRSPVNR